MDKHIIVIGASAGGFDVIRTLIAGLPADLDAAVLIVWHISPDVHGILPEVLNREHTLPARHAVEGEPLLSRRVYVAPPDHHLLIEKDTVRITRGPKENRFRPAIDPLFRSAAVAYGPNVIGVICSGALDDGTAGLWTIKQYGGVAIVQDPEEAQVPSMPESAIGAVAVDYIVAAAAIAPLLTKLVTEPMPAIVQKPADDTRAQGEIDIALENAEQSRNVYREGKLSPYTCPECQGVLTSLFEGDRIRFRCHTGHAFSADSLLSSIGENIESNLWATIRSMEESIMLLNQMGDNFAEANETRLAGLYFKTAKEAEARMSLVRQAVMNHEQLSVNHIRYQGWRADGGR
jgi:two-component system, chemotaxis family, protein-glutamate methylesterase/glutaminase